MPKRIIKIFALILSFCLLFEQSGFAQAAGQLDLSGRFTNFAQGPRQTDSFRPLHLRYLSYNNQNNSFKLLLDKGDFVSTPSLRGGRKADEAISSETKTLLKYLLIGVSLPNDSFWVNLRPDSPDSIIDQSLAKTDVGKIFLESDLKLKKDTALATSPNTGEGKKYWDLLYKKANELFGNENITIPTLTRPWIVPDEIIIRVSAQGAYIYKATLKVMLEADYLRRQGTGDRVQGSSFDDPRLKELNEYSSQSIKKLIIPKLNKKINTSKDYAPLRQVYYSLILAQWFKQNYYGKGGTYSYLINKQNLRGFISSAPWETAAYFKEYRKSFQNGEYSRQEQIKTLQGQSIRSYFSGGIALGNEIAAAAASGTVSFSPGRALPNTPHNLAIEVTGASLSHPAEVEINFQSPHLEMAAAASSPAENSVHLRGVPMASYFGRFGTLIKRNLWAVILFISMTNPFVKSLSAQTLVAANKPPVIQIRENAAEAKAVPLLKRILYLYIATMASHGFHEQAHAGKYGITKFAPWDITSGDFEREYYLIFTPSRPEKIPITNPLEIQIYEDINTNIELQVEIEKIWASNQLFEDKYAAGLITEEELLGGT